MNSPYGVRKLNPKTDTWYVVDFRKRPTSSNLDISAIVGEYPDYLSALYEADFLNNQERSR